MGLEKIVRFFSRAYAGGWGVKIFGLLCSMLLLVASGCGYDVTETTTYHAANWTSDGKIIARRLTQKHGKNLISNSIPMGSSEELVLMNEDGSGEHKLFGVDENIIKLIEMSPQGTYVGYINGNGELKVYTRGGALVGRVTPDPPVTHFKFSPDETKIYGSEDYASMVLFSVSDLSVLSQNSLGGGGGFTDNENVFFYKTSSGSGGISVYTIANQQMEEFYQGFIPEIYIASENAVYGLGSDKVYRYELGAASYTEVGFSWGPYEANDFTGKHLRGDGGRLVMGDAFENGGIGIFILNVESGSGIVRIR